MKLTIQAILGIPPPTLFVFGCLLCAPSKECCLCLFTKFGLT
jgi:hypothetical protein